ncbi:Alpha-1,3-mannosyl-glycoprotein 2-beta-N-acetylglucosaminyltransferase [Hypsibius exemplaris]|uniref:Alpha-1,3-mannosyl-glycoprotein 2-beta-N-acetylglucosaminyltransferase n=1 Tax=Hypsibius exemplaris TaxID=2072580 RepID=A0A1W0X835_HYPEX|nr:Alpha-1,3-mannosyl-glycoprotein 2-beta-N-acetylglucosaminyltransferase [Hypsibius exemplaris]
MILFGSSTRMKTKLGYFIGSGITILWILFFYQYVIFQQRVKDMDFEGAFGSSDQRLLMQINGEGSGPTFQRIAAVEGDLQGLKKDSERLQQYMDRVREVGDTMANSNVTVLTSKIPVIPVIVFACNRPTVKRNLDQLLKYRPSAESFPIYVSQDCGHKETAEVIENYGDQMVHMKHTNNTPIVLEKKDKKFEGYYKLARHYRWGLNQIFRKYNHTAAIIVEDDLDIAPDFFEYFAALYPLLVADSSLWCISAWNDNGKADLTEDAPELLYRTDFFPGLGWMLRRDLWMELEPKWPEKFWDDWMRRPEQRLKRSCIRPEVSRTSTFGKKGVSNGLFYETHLKFIKLNDVSVPFRERSLAYLLKDIYDPRFASAVYNSPTISQAALRKGDFSGVDPNVSIRVEYSTKDQFIKTAKPLGLMQDFKAGVPRCGYRGVVTLFRNGRRIFLAPPIGWNGYDLSWN